MEEVKKDQRHYSRRKTLFGGVVYDDAGNKWTCSVIEFSTLGARIRSDATLEVGGFADLKINKYNDLRRCTVIWAEDGQIGFKFLVKVDETKKGISDLLKAFGSDKPRQD